ncbi:HD-GYP domain-containing protein [Clostridium sp. DL1XJH146]
MKITNKVILTTTAVILVSICSISFLIFYISKEKEKEINSLIGQSYEKNIDHSFNLMNNNLQDILLNYSTSYNMYNNLCDEDKNIILRDLDNHFKDIADFIYIKKDNVDFEIYYSKLDIANELKKNNFIATSFGDSSNSSSFEKINDDVYIIVTNPILLESNTNSKIGVIGIGKKISHFDLLATGKYPFLQDYLIEFYTLEEELENIDNQNVIMEKKILNNKNELIAEIILKSQNDKKFSFIKKIVPLTIVIVLLSLIVIVLVFSKLIRKMKELTLNISSSLYDISQGNYHKRIPMSGYIEFDRTSKMINKLVDEVEGRINYLEESTLTTINVLTSSLEAKDPYTKGHSVRVAEYSMMIAKKMNMDELYIEKLKQAALLHDIGKIGVNEDILNKPGSLSEEEYNEIKKHPSIAANILGDYEAFKDLKEIVISHHERFDGKGYPVGLLGNEIPVGGRILAVADTFDAITSDRVYRKGMTVEKAIAIIKSEKGKQFDAIIVEAFISIVDDLKNENLHHEIKDFEDK